MRRASRGFRPVVVVALEVVAPSSLTPTSVKRMHVGIYIPGVRSNEN